VQEIDATRANSSLGEARRGREETTRGFGQARRSLEEPHAIGQVHEEDVANACFNIYN
jgi:hypothetical protein